MGGRLTVTSQVNFGSTFTFLLPCKVPQKKDGSDDSDGESAMSRCEAKHDVNFDELNGSFLFKTSSLSNGFSFCGSPALNSNLGCSGTESSLVADNGLSEENRSNSQICSKQNEEAEPEVSKEMMKDNKNRAEIFDIKEKVHQVNTGMMDVSICQSSDSSIAHKVVYSTCSPSGSLSDDDSNQIGKSKISFQPNRLEKEQNGRSEFPKTASQPKILLVEDNKINIMVAKSMLKQLGHIIDVVHNGLEAIYAVQCSHYDLILMVRIKF